MANGGAAWNDMEMDIFRVVIVLLTVVCGRDSMAVVAVVAEGCSTVSMDSVSKRKTLIGALIVPHNEGVICAS